MPRISDPDRRIVTEADKRLLDKRNPVMKQRISECLRFLRQGIADVVRLHPVETALCVLGTVSAILAFECDWRDEQMVRILAVPLFFGLALATNLFAGRGPWRRIYWVVWVPMIPLLLWPGIKEWLWSSSYALTAGVLLPLLLLSCRCVRDNRQFVSDAVVYLRSAVLAWLFANIALGLFEAILWSTAYIFGFADADWVAHLAVDAMIATETLGGPLLFLMMIDRWAGCACCGSRMLEVLMNYLLTPALIVYAAIFYLYAVRILVLWSLPIGGVAYMTFGLVFCALLGRALQELLEKRAGAWFYRWFSLIMLPVIVLFWAGVARRVGEYGLTGPRVYLLVCGGLMTFALLLFASRRTGRFLWFCAAMFVVFAAFVYIPALSPRQLAIRSQQARYERLVRSLDRIDAEGRFIVTKVSPADTVRVGEYRQLFAAMEYLAQENDGFLASIGVEGCYSVYALRRELLPPSLYDRVVYGDRYANEEVVAELPAYFECELPDNYRIESDSEYPVIYTNLRSWGAEGCRIEEDTLRVRLDGRVLNLSCDELMKRQLERCGLTAGQLAACDEESRLRMLDYRDDVWRILFREMRFECSDSTGCRLYQAEVDLIRTR